LSRQAPAPLPAGLRSARGPVLPLGPVLERGPALGPSLMLVLELERGPALGPSLMLVLERGLDLACQTRPEAETPLVRAQSPKRPKGPM